MSDDRIDLDAIRNGHAPLTPATVAALVEAVEALRGWRAWSASNPGWRPVTC